MTVSYTVPAGSGLARSRPGVVTAASYLLYLVAASQVVGGVIVIGGLDAMQRAYEHAYADFPELRDAAGGIALVTVGISVVFALIFAAGFITLGILDGKGKNAARIVTWVMAGLGVCCFGAGSAGQALNGMLSGMGGTGGTNQPDPAEIQRTLTEALPSWYYPATTAINVINLLAVIAVIILLALPASNEFFRRPAPAVEVPGYPPLG